MTLLLSAACGTPPDSFTTGPTPAPTINGAVDAGSDRGAEPDAALSEAGPSPGEACTSAADCPPSRSCCDGRCIDVAADIANCGACGVICSPQPHVVPTCVGGECKGGCEPGWADCNANLRLDGCEVPTMNDPDHCGGCNLRCSTNNVPTPTCANGLCNGSCAAGTADCDGDKRTNGCETSTSTDPNHCGTCNARCSTNNVPSPTCIDGECGGICAPGTADCNRNKAMDGCEVDTRSSATNCGACEAACSSSHIVPACGSGVCTGSCEPGWGDCDNDKRSNACETNLGSTPSHCGACGAACSANHVPAPACNGGTCTGTCEVGWGDCNGNRRADGCETDLATSVQACGGCGRVCSADHVVAPTCTGGTCSGSCAVGWMDCDADKQTNGCESDTLTDWRNCGGCGALCRRQCVTGSCACRVGLSGVPFPQAPALDGQPIHPALVTDLDGDGRADLVAVAEQGTPQVIVYLNLGGGYFGLPTIYLAGPGEHRVATGDLDRDGRPDLAVSNAHDQSVTVFLNRGGGRLDAGARYVLATNASDVAVADVDRDGYADLVVPDRSSGTLNIALNRRDGTFPDLVRNPGAVRRLNVGGNVNGLNVVDLNGDGAVDLVTAGLDKVCVLLNQGTGTFAARVEYPVATAVSDVAVGDFDRDGRPDIVTASSILPGGGVSFLASAGGGAFAPYVWSPTGGTPLSMAVGDFDADGWLDVAAGQSPGAPLVILGYQGAGRFAITRGGLWTSPLTQSVVAGDVDNDGSPDLFFDGDTYGVGVLLTLRGDYLTPPSYLTATGPNSVAIGDLDGNGSPDLAVAAEEGDRVSVLLNTGDGRFGPKSDYLARFSPRSVAIGDIEGDGRQDLVVAGGETGASISIFRNLGSGVFAPQVEVPAGGRPYAVALGDLDGDGQTDIAVARLQSLSSPAGVTILLNRGAGTFARADYPTGSDALFVAMADVNGDGHRDVVVTGRSIGVLLNSGTGALQNVILFPTVAAPQAVAIGDLNRDGLVDLAVTGVTPPGPSGTAGVLAVHLNAGGGQFPTHVEYPLQFGPVPVAMADLDGNGALDVVVGQTNGNQTIGVFLNEGLGSLGQRQDYFAGLVPHGLAVGDLDGDGTPDVAVTNNYNGLGATVRVLFNSCR